MAGVGGVGLSQKEKGLVDTDNSVGTAGVLCKGTEY